MQGKKCKILVLTRICYSPHSACMSLRTPFFQGQIFTLWYFIITSPLHAALFRENVPDFWGKKQTSFCCIEWKCMYMEFILILMIFSAPSLVLFSQKSYVGVRLIPM